MQGIFGFARLIPVYTAWSFNFIRIYITGPAGSGKSTLARKLSQYFDIPLVHLDAIEWLDDWIENPKYLDLQKQAVAESDWIIEGASCSIIKSMQDRADLVVILNTPPAGNIYRHSQLLNTKLDAIRKKFVYLSWILEVTHMYQANSGSE